MITLIAITFIDYVTTPTPKVFVHEDDNGHTTLKTNLQQQQPKLSIEEQKVQCSMFNG